MVIAPRDTNIKGLDLHKPKWHRMLPCDNMDNKDSLPIAKCCVSQRYDNINHTPQKIDHVYVKTKQNHQEALSIATDNVE